MDDAVILTRRLGVDGLIGIGDEVFRRRFDMDVARTDGLYLLEPGVDVIGPHLRTLGFKIAVARDDTVILVEIVFDFVAIDLLVAIDAANAARSDDVILVGRMDLIGVELHVRLLDRYVAFHVGFGGLQVIDGLVAGHRSLVADDDDVARRRSDLGLTVIFQRVCRDGYGRVAVIIRRQGAGSRQDHGPHEGGCCQFLSK